MKKSLVDWWTGTECLDEELETFQKKLEHLIALETDNLAVVEHEEIQPGKKRRREFEYWLTNVKGKKSVYSKIENELREQGPSKNLKSHIEKEIKEVEGLIQPGKFLNGVVLDDHASKRLPMVTAKLVGQNCVKNVETIFKLLKEDVVFCIGVYGMGGVGKTTIVKEIHNRLLLDSAFAGHVYWVTASRGCSLEKLQNDIGKVVGLQDFSKEDNERKKALLLHRFSGIKKSVLIIDDLWDSYLMEKIGVPFESCGCKVLITTRNMEVWQRMPCQKTVRIMPLTKPDSWILFLEKLGELSSDLKDIAVKIVDECAGLPLALITMGCCMRGKTCVHEWENALYELRKPARRQDLMEVEVFRVLKFSFDSLKDQKVQNCFLSCVLFPEDKQLDEDVLVDLWINEGLLDEVENQNRVNKGHCILNELVSACLLESTSEGRQRRVKVHDLIRDMGIMITKEHPLFIAEVGKQLKQVPEEEQWSKDLVKVSLSCNCIMEIPSGMAPLTPKLTVLLLRGNPLEEIPDSFFVHMKALTVLDLSATKIQRIPESVSDLENLRGLLLANCRELIYVPSVAKLTKLRTLDLADCSRLKMAPRGLERLKCLEKVSYIFWDVFNIIGFNEVIQSLNSLSSYKFWICDFKLSASFVKRQAYYVYEKVVWIKGGEIGEDKSSCLLLTTLECLIIDNCDIKGRCLEDVFQTLGEATGVKYIDIFYCRGLESISGSSGTQRGSFSTFPQLECLRIELLPDLGSIAKPVVPDSFSCLRYLIIIRCPKMKVVLPLTFTNQLHLPYLETIEVGHCVGVEEIFESNKTTLPNPLVLPKLKTLQLWWLPKIKVIFPFPEESHVPDLESISVRECEEVEEIFETNKANPSKPILSLPKLKDLNFYNLPKLGSIYRGLLVCASLAILPNSICGCPKLRLWRLPGCVTSTKPCSPMESHYMNSINQPACCLPHSDDPQ